MSGWVLVFVVLLLILVFAIFWVILLNLFVVKVVVCWVLFCVAFRFGIVLVWECGVLFGGYSFDCLLIYLSFRTCLD